MHRQELSPKDVAAAWLKWLRLHHRLTQAALAAKLGISDKHLSGLEHGKRRLALGLARSSVSPKRPSVWKRCLPRARQVTTDAWRPLG